MLLVLTTLRTASAHPTPDEVRAEVTGCDVGAWLDAARGFGAEGRVEDGLAALAEARACGADAGTLALARGTLLLRTRPDLASTELEAALAARPAHPGALVAHARAALALGRPESAVADLRALPSPSPDERLLLARTLRDLGRLDEALAVLDDGPPAVALVEEAVAIERLAGRPEAAEGRLDAMPDTPYWVWRRAGLDAPRGR